MSFNRFSCCLSHFNVCMSLSDSGWLITWQESGNRPYKVGSMPIKHGHCSPVFGDHLLTGRVDSPFQHFWIITSVDFCIDTGGHFSHWDLQHAGFLKDCFKGMELQDFYCVVLKGSSDAKFTFTCCLNINVCWQCLYTSTL